MAATGARKLFLTVLTSLSVLGIGTLAIFDPQVLAGAPKPDYSLSATTQTVTQATSGTTPVTFPVTVTRSNGYNDPVQLGYNGLPAGVTFADWSPADATVDSSMDGINLDLNVASTVKVGTYTFTITAVNANTGKDARNTKATLGVAAPASGSSNFSLTVTPLAQTVQIGGSPASYLVRVLGTVPTGGVALSATGLPGGTTASFGTNPVNTSGGTSNLSVATSSKTHAGQYHFTVTGTNGKVKYNVTVQLTIQAPPSSGFTLGVSPNQQQVAAGAAATYAVGIARSPGFGNAPVSLSVTGLPTNAGFTVSWDPSDTTSGNAVNLTISTDEITTPDGNFNFTISGTDGASPAHNASVKATLAVNTPPGKAFGISGNASGLMYPGTGAPINLTLSNPNDKPILITNLTVSIASVTKAADAPAGTCTANDYQLSQYSGGYPIRLEKRTTQSLQSLGVPVTQQPSIQLTNDPINKQDACKGATVALSYSGNAREAG